MGPIGIAALLAGGTSLLSGLLNIGASFGSQAWSQDFNSAEAQKSRDFTAEQNQLNRDFNSAEAQKSRDWQEYMSNTAYQRQIADMKQAGINPNVINGGGASSVSGANASYSSSGNGAQASSNASSFGGLSSAVPALLFGSLLNTAAKSYEMKAKFGVEFINALAKLN